MRKTTDPHEHKYLIDREFNTFGRGAIEDCPAELLYGKGALSAGFNVNCHQQYFEGRTGSVVFSRIPFPALEVWARKEGNTIIALAYNERPSASQVEDAHYLTWPDGRRELLLHGSLVLGTQAPFEIHFRTETDTPQPYPILVKCAVTGKPSIWHWHTELKLWVRLEAGVFATASWDIKEWRRVDIIDGEFAPGRSSFVETRTGGFIYNLDGIFRWIAETNEVFRINTESPFMLRSYDESESYGMESDNKNHAYRYLVTGTRIRNHDLNQNAGQNFSRGIVDYETSAIEFNWKERGTGLMSRINPVSVDYPALLIVDIDQEKLGAVTHLSVYRTLDLDAIDVSDPNRTQFNSPNRFGLVGDFPLWGPNIPNHFAYVEIVEREGEKWLIAHEGRLPPLGPNWGTAIIAPNKVMIGFIVEETFTGGTEVRVRSNTPLCTGALAVGEEPLERAHVFEYGRRSTIKWADGYHYRKESLLGNYVYLSNGRIYRVINASDDGVVTLDGDLGKTSGRGALLIRHESAQTLFYDNVDDDTLRGRYEFFYPRTRFCKPLPNCNIAAAIPGFVMCAIAGESKLYYTQDDTMGGYTYGSHNPIQINEQIKDSIQHIELFPDVAAVISSRSTWKFPTGLADYYEEPGNGHAVPVITKIELVDNNIGCVEPYSIQHIPGGQIALVTREGEQPAVRTFNGHAYSRENYLEDAALGLSRNKRKVRLTRGAIAVYSEATGYIIWRGSVEGMESEFGDLQLRPNESGANNDDRQGRPNEEEIRIQAVLDMGNGNSEQAAFKDGWDVFYDRGQTRTTYCFRVAMRGDQGGGVTEYGGEHWVWPDIRAVSVTHGFDPEGDRITLVEDIRTGVIYRIGLAEQWLDKLDENGKGFYIPTRIALPTIADGYKWQKHLETHIAMRCWAGAYRGAQGYTADGFKTAHKCDIRIYEDGELIDHVSELKDLNRNGDYAYIKKVEARRIQEVIETTTAAFRISQIVTKVQTSNREALPGDNLPSEILYQKEWRNAIVHLSRNLPYPIYNRADGTDLEGHLGGITTYEVDGPFGRQREAFTPALYLIKRFGYSYNITVSMWFLHGGSVQGGYSYRIFDMLKSDDYPQRDVPSLYRFVDYDDSQRLVVYTTGFVWTLDTEYLGKWTHVVVRLNNETLSLFADGTKTGEIRCAGILAGSGIQIGNQAFSSFFDVRVMNRAVSDESIRSYYEAVKRGGEGWLP